ncbi:MAG: hypothetical protein NZ992_01215 [Candidatus Korarchaeum sp.]|nr:hypothetical protein [Candidatus Korarchaeum sp.]MDW8036324.1 hypothetical protein [Candidatus Korarchaeum sp.]
MLNENFSSECDAPKSFSLIPPPTSSLHYNISCKSSGPLELALIFLDEEGGVLSKVNLSGEGNIRSEDHEYFTKGPREVCLTLRQTDEASCRLRIHYAHFDNRLLLTMIAVQLLTSALAISLISSCYLMSRRSGSRAPLELS